MDLQKKRRRFAIVMAGGRGGRRVPRIALSANTVTEGASINTVIGALSIVNPLDGDPTGWTFTETADPDTKFNISSANLRTSGTWAYTPSTTAYSVTITASKSGQTDIVQTFSVNVQAVLGNLALDSYTWTPGVPASGSITGAHDANEVITLGSGWPSGLTINSAARTWAYDGTGTDSTGIGSLIGTHPQATNSPHTTSGLGWTLATVDSDATALFARMTTPPSSERQTQIERAIVAMKAAGTWVKRDFLYMPGADAQAASLNWKSTSYNLTQMGSPTFTADTMWNATGASGAYLATGYNPSTGATWTRNGANLTLLDKNIADISAGIGEFDGTDGATIVPFVSGNTTADGRVNQAGGTDFVRPRGFACVSFNRSGATALQGYYDGIAQTLTANGSEPSTAVNNSTFDIGKWHDTVFAADWTMVFAAGGGSLTAPEVAGEYSAVANYLINIVSSLNVIADGNSITAGSTASAAYTAILAAQAPYTTNSASFHNLGVPGQTTEDMTSSITDVTAAIDKTKLNLLIAWEGTNSIYFGDTAAQAFDAMAAYVAAAHAIWSMRVAVVTVLPRYQQRNGQAYNQTNVDSYNAEIDAYNTLLRTRYTEFADYLYDIRLAGSPFALANYLPATFLASGQFTSETDSGNTVYVHPNDTGQASIASIVDTALRGL